MSRSGLGFAAVAAVLCLAGAGCSGGGANPGKGAGKKLGPVGVRVAAVEKRDVPLEIEAVGNVEAYASVAVKSRVAGQLMRVHVREGADVRRGDLLFEIDPAPFEEQVRSAEAALLRDRAAERQAAASIARVRAESANARAQAQRYMALFKEGVGAKEQADQYRTAAEAQEAQVKVQMAARESAQAAIAVDEARLEETQRELSYTKITAPMAGRAGFVGIKAGNLVRENDTAALVTILQVTPVFVTFAVPEKHLSAIRGAGQGLRVATSNDDVGTLEVIDNAVDASTGTIKLKARFENAARNLWPGQFTNVKLRLRTEAGALVFPEAALQTGPQGNYVWVEKGGVAEMRMLAVERMSNGWCVAAKGVNEGDRVVTAGQLRVTPGAKLDVLPEAARPEATGGR
ncbi:MAG: efflux RND transporter periplasmic adaptor subunit [Candidatus Solibacter sp.]|nr:efflux RND transporter periplasmic adaptor subunit [Candidatus Solibacter sp.]